MTQEMMIMAAILVLLSVFFLVTVSVKVTKYSLYMVRPAMIRSRRNCIMVALLLFGLLYRAMNSCL